MALALIAALAGAGCAARVSAPMRNFAQKYIDTTDAAYKKLLRHQTRVRDKMGVEDVSKSPAFALVGDAASALDLFEVRRKEYRAALKDKKEPQADAGALKRLKQVRDAFRDCAFLLCVEVKDALPAYYVWKDTPPAPEEILKSARQDLGVDEGEEPSQDACNEYVSLSLEVRRELKLDPPPAADGE